jgi:hypothetical protein
LIGIEPEVIQCAKSDGIGGLVLGKSFAVPSYRIGGLRDSPRRTAISVTSRYIVVCPARFLRRRVKRDVTYVNSRPYWHAERLDAAIQILVIKRVLVVPDSGRGIGHFVTHEPDAIITRIRLDLVHGCARPRPCHNGRLHPHRAAEGRKCEVRWRAGNSILAVGSVVILVALPRMSLAPCIFSRRNVLAFGKIGRAWVLRRV